jgi:hypothetical protein
MLELDRFNRSLIDKSQNKDINNQIVEDLTVSTIDIADYQFSDGEEYNDGKVQHNRLQLPSQDAPTQLDSTPLFNETMRTSPSNLFTDDDKIIIKRPLRKFQQVPIPKSKIVNILDDDRMPSFQCSFRGCTKDSYDKCSVCDDDSEYCKEHILHVIHKDLKA